MKRDTGIVRVTLLSVTIVFVVVLATVMLSWSVRRWRILNALTDLGVEISEVDSSQLNWADRLRWWRAPIETIDLSEVKKDVPISSLLIAAIEYNPKQLLLANSAIDDSFLSRCSHLTSCEVFDASHTRVTGAGLSSLGGWLSLWMVTLDGCEITNSDLRNLPPNVSWLSLNDTKITDGAFARVSFGKSLHGVFLDRTHSANEVCRELRGFEGLIHVSLAETELTDTGLVELGALPNLHLLNICDNKVTGVGLKALSSSKLIELRLDGCPLTTSDIAMLSGQATIRVLSLRRTQIDDAVAGLLVQWTVLSTLDLRDTQISTDTVNELRRSLPNCEILR